MISLKEDSGAYKLWEEHQGLAKSMARKRFRMVKSFLGDCKDDLEQAAMLGLWEAALKYDSTKETAFSTYAWEYIRGALNCERWRLGFWGFAAEKAKAYKGIILLDRKPLDNVKEGIIERRSYASNHFEDEDLLTFLISQLRPVKSQTVARRFWLEGLSTATIAHQMTLSEVRIEQIRAKAKKDLIELANIMERMWNR